ncbi:hypothetical protein P7C71_g5792, partial [Lecanoromycetidae sp. Uapishka_2]
MAAPRNIDLHHLTGKWMLNKALSDDISPILALQGTNTILRKAISSASVTLSISQPNTNEYKIHQTATAASIPGTTEQYILDNEWRKNSDAFFGEVDGRSRWIDLDEAKSIEGVQGHWEQGDGKLILAEGGKPDGSWSATRVWGFEEIGNDRRYTQRVKVWSKDGKEVRVNMVYDFVQE